MSPRIHAHYPKDGVERLITVSRIPDIDLGIPPVHELGNHAAI